MMRIGIDIRSLIEKSPSGVTEYTNLLLTNLMRMDKENQYLLFYNSWHHLPENLLKIFKCSNVEVKSFHWPNKIFNSSLVILNYPQIDRLLGGVDLLFVPNLNFLTWSRECKKIITVHDLSFIRYPEFYSKKGQFWHKITKPKKIFNDADKIIAVSKNTKSDLINLYDIEANKVEVIHSGINLDFFQKLAPDQLTKIREKYEISKPYIFTLSNLEPRKNIESLILAFDYFRKKYKFDYQLVIAGGEAWTQNKKIHVLAKQSSFYTDIKFLGYIPSSDKPALYQAASVFVYPSFYEGFGFPPLEAMASGVSVVCSDSSSLPEVAKDAALLFDSYNVSELVEVIFQILTDKKLKRKLIEKGKEQVKSFSWEKTAGETLELFKEVV